MRTALFNKNCLSILRKDDTLFPKEKQEKNSIQESVGPRDELNVERTRHGNYTSYLILNEPIIKMTDSKFFILNYRNYSGASVAISVNFCRKNDYIGCF